MRGTVVGWWLVVAGCGLCGVLQQVEAADPEVSVILAPVRQIIVDGDKEKFRAHHWMKDGYTGGIQEFSAHHTFDNGVVVSSEGHALIDQNDLGSELLIEKEGLGFAKLDYSEFRKYFEGTGGVHRRYSTLQVNETDKELALDLGAFELETGLAVEGWPQLALLYEREFKDGAKSRLTWPSVKDDGETRKIAPSWQDIEEIVDVFALQANHEVAGFALTGEQRWELSRSENFREERQLSTTSTASDQKIRRQDQAPEANLMTTTLGGSRSFFDEKMFFSSGYHYAHLRNREFETLAEFSAAGVLTNYTYPEQKPNNRADSGYDSHTWVGNVTVRPWPTLSFTTKLKSEVVKRDSNSTYNHDFRLTNSSGSATAPDGVADATIFSLADTKMARWGQSWGVRYTGIPRTALYTELELEQARILLREDRTAVDNPAVSGDGTANLNETFNRQTVTDVRRGNWTLGGQIAPWSMLNLTAQVRRRVNDNDYDDQRESDPGGTTARSAFMDGQNIHTNEFATRATLRPCRWFRSSLRYQLRDDNYSSRIETEPIVKTGLLSHIYTYDVTVQPLPELTATTSFSRQTMDVSTPARSATYAPDFQADVNTWLYAVDYAPTPAVQLTHTLQYSQARNFNDFANNGLPLGADYTQLDLSNGVRWALRDGASVGMEYTFYHYQPNSNVEQGDYDAHAIWLEISKEF